MELFCQVKQILEFDSIGAFETFRIEAGKYPEWKEIEIRIEELAPERYSRLLEPLGSIPPETLHKAAVQSQESPLGVYSLAILDVAPGKMPKFIAALEEAAKRFPILASWRSITGKQNEVIDVWKGALRQERYKPADDFTKEFFRGVREMASRERMIPVYSLPYSETR